MSQSSRYKNTIWTNHVRERLLDRCIPIDHAWKTLHYPESTVTGKKSGTTEYSKRIGKHILTVIATQNEKREWVVLSCWARPPYPGSMDIKKRNAYFKYKQSSLAGKIWIHIKRMFGIYE